MKTLIIYHDADFDGLLSHEVCKFFLKDLHEVTSFGWDYGKPVPTFAGYDQVFMVDISIDSLMTMPNLIWIDHHKTAIQKYPPTLPGYRIDGVAACRLAWQWFANAKAAGLPILEEYLSRKVSEPMLLTLAGEHDIWDHHDERTLPLQDGLRQLDTYEWDDLVKSQFTDGEKAEWRLNEAISIGRRALKARQKANESIMRKRAHDIQWHGYRWLCCNGVSSSQAFASIVNESHEGLLAWVYDGQTKKATVSLYHAPAYRHLDLSIIAKEFGGGGHAGACGFQISLEDLVCILDPYE